MSGDGGGRRVWRLGLVGAGRFGRFCLEQLRGWRRVTATAVTDAVPQVARAAAEEYGLAFRETPEELFQDDVDLALISTPPDTHYDLTLRALAAGVNVLCEKPLALTAGQADDALRAAHQAGRVLVANHMLRYSPLLETVEQIIRERVLGEPRHVFFENYAEDERLPADHWFWDREHSGGMFVEHAVHFFDLHSWWFGPGEVLAAHAEPRLGTPLVDRVWCQTRHDGGVLGQQYHQFDQPARLDRADHRVVFERGQLVVHGWVPIELLITGIVDEGQQKRLHEICEACDLAVLQRYEGDQQDCRGGGKSYRVTARVAATRDLTEDRGWIYGEMIRRLLDDQLQVLEDPHHVPRLRGKDARAAVAMAEAATRLAGGT